jgi:diadenosine tetraphosphatase ApaH/serine/threonine PP2A family protein phosphatase
MRYLVLSDVHANTDALDAALGVAATAGYDRVLVLGDLVGYGGDPNGAVNRVRQLDPLATIRGNHDRVASGIDSAENFNPAARNAAMWTRSAIDADNLAYLAQLPEGPLQVDDLVEICHGTPLDEDAYVFDSLDAIRSLNDASRPVCLFGHTHSPLALYVEGRELAYERTDHGTVFALRDGARYLINGGSIGQPRDSDPRAAFVIVDTGARTVEFFRVPYDVAAAQERIRRAGLPESLAARLALGR